MGRGDGRSYRNWAVRHVLTRLVIRTFVMRPKLSETKPLADLSPRGVQSLTGGRRSVSDPRAGESDDDFVVPPPATVQVEAAGRTVLFGPHGERLVRRIGY